jgi:hypothetical protein
MAANARMRLKELCDKHRWTMNFQETVAGAPHAPLFSAEVVVRDAAGADVMRGASAPRGSKREAHEAAAAVALGDGDAATRDAAMLGRHALAFALNLLAHRAGLSDASRADVGEQLLSEDALAHRAATEHARDAALTSNTIPATVGAALAAEADALLPPLLRAVRVASAPLADAMEAAVAQTAQRAGSGA